MLPPPSLQDRASKLSMAGPAPTPRPQPCPPTHPTFVAGLLLQTLATDYKKVHKIHDQLFIGLAGLGTDAETL